MVNDEKKIDLPKAASLTAQVLERGGGWLTSPERVGETTITYEHCMKLLRKIMKGDVVGAQADRFLGWVQACACVHMLVKQDVFADINRSCRLEKNNA